MTVQKLSYSIYFYPFAVRCVCYVTLLPTPGGQNLGQIKTKRFQQKRHILQLGYLIAQWVALAGNSSSGQEGRKKEREKERKKDRLFSQPSVNIQIA